MVDLGPLTTTFTPPGQGCEDSTELYRIITTTGAEYLVQGPRDYKKCLPSSFQPMRDAYYSPGVCPSGYTVACSKESVAGDVTETYQTCCPTVSDFECRRTADRRHQQSFLCYIDYTSSNSATWSLESLVEINEEDNETITRSLPGGSPGGAINAYGVQVRFVAEDMQTTTMDGSSLSTSSASPSQSSGGALETSSAQSTEGSSGLSTAATAGVAVGAVAGGIVLGGLFALIWLRRRRQKKQQLEQPPIDQSPMPMGHQQVYTGYKGPEWYQQQQPMLPQEMGGTESARPIEMDATGENRR